MRDNDLVGFSVFWQAASSNLAVRDMFMVTLGKAQSLGKRFVGLSYRKERKGYQSSSAQSGEQNKIQSSILTDMTM